MTATDHAQRLQALLDELARRGLDGFLVPLADEHQGEYVPARAQRLAWLTGFTGSAGLAIVRRAASAIFVDGRYTLQVRAQVDQNLFTPQHLTENPPDAWLSAQVQAGEKIGYDPWLHTPHGLRALAAACTRAGAELVAVDDNPLDAVWHDQPPPPQAPVVPHPLDYAGEAAAAKRGRLGKLLADGGADAALLTLPDSIAWLLNIRGGDVERSPLPLSFALLNADGSVSLCIDPVKTDETLRRHLGDGVTLETPDRLGAVLDALRGKTVRVDPGTAADWLFRRLRAADATIDEGADPCLLPKAQKNAVELAGARAAHRRDGAALTRFLHWLEVATADPGHRIDELAAEAKLAEFRRATGALKDLSFDTIAGAGPNGAIVHYRVSEASNRPLAHGTLFLVDSGGQYLDGTTDVTRTAAIGAPGDEHRDRFTRVLKGHIALARARFPAGTSGAQLDVLARQALWQAGLDYDHGTGHGVGSYLCVHEGPQRISKAPNGVALLPGMIVSNEPGYYKTGEYGIRIENLVAVTAADTPPGGERPMHGFETLTLAPIDRRLIEPALLDDGERGWLNAYHQRVRDTLTPLLDGPAAATRDWLRAVTAPL